MDDLSKRALHGLLWFQVVLAALIFVPAWSLTYWQGWVYWLVFGASIVAITIYFLRHDRALVERRMRAGPTAERETSQKVIQALASILMCALMIVSALDHRLGWSSVPTWLVIAGNVLVALGFLIIFRVFRENSFAASTVQIAAGQTVVSTGPYALVRHPMYSGALLLFLGTPLAL